MRTSEIKASLEIIEVKPGVKFNKAMLIKALPDTETTLFFGKLYKLDAKQLGTLLNLLFGDKSTVIDALTGQSGAHSHDLQDYVVDLGYETQINSGAIEFTNAPPPAEVLPELWDAINVEIADSIIKVAEKLGDIVSHMPGKEGAMVFQSMMMMNAKRPILGDFKARIKHKRAARNLVILDVSGSMSESTIRTIIDDVVALSWKADACLAIVSDTTTFWNPGEYTSDAVLKAAEFSGTHYETLVELLNQDWGVVVSIADYDSSHGARSAVGRCTGNIDLLLDISLVDRPTFLAECVGQRATEVRPLLVAAHGTQLTRSW